MSLRIQVVVQIEHLDGTPLTACLYTETSMNPRIGNFDTEAAAATGTVLGLIERAKEDTNAKLEQWAEASNRYTREQKQKLLGDGED